jgi:hypothetical protein
MAIWTTALNFLGNSVLEDRFLAGDFVKGCIAAVLVQLPVAVEGVLTYPMILQA